MKTNSNTNRHCAFVSLFHTFSSWRKLIVYTPSQGANKEKYFNHNNE